MKQKLKNMAQEIIEAEQEIRMGKNIKSNEDKIEFYMSTLSQSDLLELCLYLEEVIDK